MLPSFFNLIVPASLFGCFSVLQCFGLNTQSIPATQRGLWIWDSAALLTNTTDQAVLWQTATASSSLRVSDIYLYTPLSAMKANGPQLSAFLSAAKAKGLRVWAMEGSRTYFRDIAGPTHEELNDTLAAVITFNTKASTSANKFYGFHLDIEPADVPDYPPTFHNGIADTKLNQKKGGEFYATQAQDREMLMQDWVSIHQDCYTRLHAAGMQLSSALPTWIMTYFGEALSVNYGGKRDLVGVQLMKWVDEACIMSYRTNVSVVLSLVQPILNVAPCRIRLGMDVVKGVGTAISYADAVGKATKSVVLADMALLETQSHVLMGPNVTGSFAGVNVNDWAGWKALSN